MTINILLLNLFLIFFVGENFTEAYDGGLLSAGDVHTCALDVEGVKCWGDNPYGQAKVLPLKNPTSVSAGGHHTCALDDEGVKCWGYYGQTNVPPLKNPISVSAGGYHTCAIDDESVKCWGYNSDGQTNVPPLKNPISVSAGWLHTCAIDIEGIKCWGRDSDDQTKVPPFMNPTAVSAGGKHTCALDDEGVKCWGENKSGQTSVPALKNPISVSAGYHHTCVIDDDGVKCWGRNSEGQTSVPALKNPISVSAGDDHTCALDYDGVKCWGTFFYGQANIPSLFFFEVNRLEIFIYRLANWSTPVRTSFFSSLKSFVNNNLKATEASPVPDQLVHGRYLFTAFLKTSIETGDSAVYTEKINPVYTYRMKAINEQTGILGLDQVKDFALTRLVALKVMQASLSTMTEFLTAEDKAYIQDIINLIDFAMSDVSNKQSITNALIAIDANEAVINKLNQSSKTQFLVLTLKTAQQWLNEKIK